MRLTRSWTSVTCRNSDRDGGLHCVSLDVSRRVHQSRSSHSDHVRVSIFFRLRLQKFLLLSLSIPSRHYRRIPSSGQSGGRRGTLVSNVTV
jgi:hypothetical protein